MRYIIVGFVCFVACSGGGDQAVAERESDLVDVIEQLRVRSAELDAARAASLDSAARSEELVTTSCPDAVVAAARRGTAFDGFRRRIIDIDRLTTLPGLRHEAKTELADELERRASDSRSAESVRTEAELHASPTTERYEVTLVVTERLDARTHGTEFDAGHLVGRLFVWDYSDGTVVCAAEARVETGEVEMVTAGSGERAEHELRERLQTELFDTTIAAVGLELSAP